MWTSVAALRSRAWRSKSPPAAGPTPGSAPGARWIRSSSYPPTRRTPFTARIHTASLSIRLPTRAGRSAQRKGSRKSGSASRWSQATALSSSGGLSRSTAARRSPWPGHRGSRLHPTVGSPSSTTTGDKQTVEPRPGRAGGALAQRSDVDLPLARTVELAEEDPLPRSERKLPVVERHEDLRAHQRGTDVRGSVGPIGVLDVPPLPA